MAVVLVYVQAHYDYIWLRAYPGKSYRRTMGVSETRVGCGHTTGMQDILYNRILITIIQHITTYSAAYSMLRTYIYIYSRPGFIDCQTYAYV